MKIWLSRLAAVVGAIAASLALSAPAQAEKRVALVIGNNDYKNVPKLRKAVNDARTMGDTLKQLGFSVMVAENHTRQAFSETLLPAIVCCAACRNNPFERSGTRALAGRGGLAPMTQLPEGVFSVFSAGPRQTALDRLSNNDNNPNSVFTRTFARELLQPGENLVQVAQHTRRIVSEMAETVSHKQIPVYFDQMVDEVFLNGIEQAQGDRAK